MSKKKDLSKQIAKVYPISTIVHGWSVNGGELYLLVRTGISEVTEIHIPNDMTDETMESFETRLDQYGNSW